MTGLASLATWQLVLLGIYGMVSLFIASTVMGIAINDQRHRWHYQDVAWKARHVLVCAGLWLVFLVAWPVLTLIVMIDEALPSGLPRWLRQAREDDGLTQPPEPPFAIMPEHLGEPVDPVAVESAAYVDDPLQGVPHLPFGHLHARWRQLRVQIDTTCTLRPFAVPRRGFHRGTQELHEGWAVVGKAGDVVSYWVVEKVSVRTAVTDPVGTETVTMP